MAFKSDFGIVKLVRDEVHVWVGDDAVTGPQLSAYESVLDAAETARASRFRFEPDRRRFVVAHGLLRSTLALYGYGRPETLSIARRCAVCGEAGHGKPYLALPKGEPAPVRFSLSYSDRLVALALCDGREVGIDVEAADRDAGWQEVAGHVFSSVERRSLDALDGDAARRAFYEVWTRKEAVSKVSGLGLTEAAEIDTSEWTYGAGGTFDVPRAASGGSWPGRDLVLEDPYFGAVVVGGPAGSYGYFSADHQENVERIQSRGGLGQTADSDARVREVGGRRAG